VNAAVVLVIEDELPIRRFLRPAIEGAGLKLLEAADGRSGLLLASQSPPDVIVLDIGLPDGDGIDLISELREWFRGPIIVLSARGQESDKVRALDAGADDYVQKPFSVGELLARLRVALRHAASTSSQAVPSAIVEFGDVRVDRVRREVHRAGELVHLTPLEYKLLGVLLSHAGLVLTHRQLLKDVWGPGHAEDSQYLRLFMHQLRQKLEANPSQPKHLITEAGVGYRLRMD